MHCRHCGGKIHENAEYCSNCGEPITQPTEEPTENDTTEPEVQEPPNSGPVEWNPSYPIVSVFSAVMLFWVWTAYNDLIFVIAGILIIPRVRKYLVPELRDRTGVDFDTKALRVVVAAVYAILTAISIILMGSYAGEDSSMAASPVTWLFVWILMVLIAGAIAVAIVGGIRIARKIGSDDSSETSTETREHTENTQPSKRDPNDASQYEEQETEQDGPPVGKSREDESVSDEPDPNAFETPSTSATDSASTDDSVTVEDPDTESGNSTDWWRGVQVFGGAMVFLLGIGLSIQSPVGVPVLILGLAMIPAVRHWGMNVLGRANSE